MQPEDSLKAFSIERYAVVFGISALSGLSRETLLKQPKLRIALPDNLIRLILLAYEESEEHLLFLHQVVSEFTQDELRVSPRELATNLFIVYRFLEDGGHLLTITEEETDNQVRFELEESFDDERYFISLSPRNNFVREYYEQALSWAKRTGGLIVEKTSYFFTKVGHHIASLQIPDRIDNFLETKRKHIDRLFAFKSGKGVKWFIGTVSGTAGLYHPLLAVPGLLIVYMDP